MYPLKSETEILLQSLCGNYIYFSIVKRSVIFELYHTATVNFVIARCEKYIRRYTSMLQMPQNRNVVQSEISFLFGELSRTLHSTWIEHKEAICVF